MKIMKCAPIALAAMLTVSAAFSSTCARDRERTPETPGNQTQSNKAEAEVIDVRVVSTAECLNTPPTVKLIQETAIELGLPVHISRQVVTTQEEANRYRFMGSPTVQIDGLDLQPDMRANTKYGFT